MKSEHTGIAIFQRLQCSSLVMFVEKIIRTAKAKTEKLSVTTKVIKGLEM